MSYNLRECKLQNSQFVQYRLEDNSVYFYILKTVGEEMQKKMLMLR